MFSILFGQAGKDVADFARTLATALTKRYSPELDQQPAKRPSATRMTRLIEETCQKAVMFNQEKKLSWVGRARFANEFRWSLKECGYTKEFIEFATEAVTVYLNR